MITCVDVLQMWIISTVMFINCIDFVMLRPREVPAAMHAASIALIFALPGIRNSMAGVPPLGVS